MSNHLIDALSHVSNHNYYTMFLHLQNLWAKDYDGISSLDNLSNS